jgi:predicted CoA-binding protein
MKQNGVFMAQVIENESTIADLVRGLRRVAVLGIKPESQRGKPAFDVPAALLQLGLTIVPVPVYYPEVTEILGQPVYRELEAVPGPVDLVDVFRRPEDIGPHVEALIALKPRAVWFQLGIRNDSAAHRLAESGIDVVQDRCLLVEYRRFVR